MIIDINECLEDNGGCAERCNNTEGGYFCDCYMDSYEVIQNSEPCQGEYIHYGIFSHINTYPLYVHIDVMYHFTQILMSVSNGYMIVMQMLHARIHQALTTVPVMSSLQEMDTTVKVCIHIIYIPICTCNSCAYKWNLEHSRFM